MTKLIRVILCFALLLIPNLSFAGYVYKGGYYFDEAGTAYTRDINWYKDWYWVYPTCNYCGYWNYTWKYNYTYTAVTLDPTSDNFESQVMSIAKARDAAENERRTLALKHVQRLELVNALGMTGNFRMEAYGRNPMMPTIQGNLQLSSAGLQGNSVYGTAPQYQVLQFETKGVDQNLLMAQIGRTTDRTIDLAGTALNLQHSTTNNVSSNESRVRETIARSVATNNVQAGAAQVYKATEPPPETKLKTITFGAQPPKIDVVTTTTQPTVPVNGNATVYLQLLGPGKCVSCHSGQKISGSFDISVFNPDTASAEEFDRVNKYISRSDGKGCPKEGVKLSAADVREILTGKKSQ